MLKRTVSSLGILLTITLAAAFLAGCGGASVAAAPAAPTGVPVAQGTPPSNQSAAALDGRTLMQQRCSVCHGLSRITNAYGTADEWKAAVDQMIAFGAQLTPAEEQVLVDYLAKTYHP
jgi:cytochrome c5